jgi:hypothetical protein
MDGYDSFWEEKRESAYSFTGQKKKEILENQVSLGVSVASSQKKKGKRSPDWYIWSTK